MVILGTSTLVMEARMNKTAKRRCDTLIDYGELEMLKFMLVGGLYEQPFMFGHDRECSLN